MCPVTLFIDLDPVGVHLLYFVSLNDNWDRGPPVLLVASTLVFPKYI